VGGKQAHRRRANTRGSTRDENCLSHKKEKKKKWTLPDGPAPNLLQSPATFWRKSMSFSLPLPLLRPGKIRQPN